LSFPLYLFLSVDKPCINTHFFLEWITEFLLACDRAEASAASEKAAKKTPSKEKGVGKERKKTEKKPGITWTYENVGKQPTTKQTSLTETMNKQKGPAPPPLPIPSPPKQPPSLTLGDRSLFRGDSAYSLLTEHSLYLAQSMDRESTSLMSSDSREAIHVLECNEFGAVDPKELEDAIMKYVEEQKALKRTLSVGSETTEQSTPKDNAKDKGQGTKLVIAKKRQVAEGALEEVNETSKRSNKKTKLEVEVKTKTAGAYTVY